MIYMAKKKPLEVIRAQLDAFKKPAPGETDKDFLIRKGVIKRV
jgi:hypothetical protein